MWIWIANKFAKFHAKRLNRNENIPKSFRGGGYFFWNTRYILIYQGLCGAASAYLAETSKNRCRLVFKALSPFSQHVHTAGSIRLSLYTQYPHVTNTAAYTLAAFRRHIKTHFFCASFKLQLETLLEFLHLNTPTFLFLTMYSTPAVLLHDIASISALLHYITLCQCYVYCRYFRLVSSYCSKLWLGHWWQVDRAAT